MGAHCSFFFWQLIGTLGKIDLEQNWAVPYWQKIKILLTQNMKLYHFSVNRIFAWNQNFILICGKIDQKGEIFLRKEVRLPDWRVCHKWYMTLCMIYFPHSLFFGAISRNVFFLLLFRVDDAKDLRISKILTTLLR